MAESKFGNRRYILFILSSLIPPTLLILAPDIPSKILGIIAAFSWLASLYVCNILEPLFRSWKAFSFWHTIDYCVEQYVKAKEAVAEGEDIILTGTYDFAKAQAKPRDRLYFTKFDEVCSRLQSVVERYRKEEHELEFLLEKLHTLENAFFTKKNETK